MLGEECCTAGADRSAAEDAFRAATGPDLTLFNLRDGQFTACRLCTITRASVCSDPLSAAAASATRSASVRPIGRISRISNCPLGQRARFVEYERIDLRRLLEDYSTSHENPAASQTSDCGHHGSGSCEDQGARTGHEEHRDRPQPISREIKRQCGNDQQCRQEVLCVLIGQAFNRCALRPGLLDQRDHARQRCLRARACDTDPEQTDSIQSTGIHLLAGFLVARQRFAGNRALIHARDAGENHSIGWNALAGTHQNDVAGDERTGIDFALFAVLHAGVRPAASAPRTCGWRLTCGRRRSSPDLRPPA